MRSSPDSGSRPSTGSNGCWPNGAVAFSHRTRHETGVMSRGADRKICCAGLTRWLNATMPAPLRSNRLRAARGQAPARGQERQQRHVRVHDAHYRSDGSPCQPSLARPLTWTACGRHPTRSPTKWTESGGSEAATRVMCRRRAPGVMPMKWMANGFATVGRPTYDSTVPL